MIGLDTTFLVAWEMIDHADHERCRDSLASLLDAESRFAVTAGVLAEFVHVVTDPRRFSNPLAMSVALSRVAFWGTAVEVRVLAADQRCVECFIDWMTRRGLGRKRLLDTLLAATFHVHGIRQILSLNNSDFEVFDCFEFPL
ncbi:MAG: type II toxin-antitoxin system VapC family toxin [Verrucomicrobiales bacterium]